MIEDVLVKNSRSSKEHKAALALNYTVYPCEYELIETDEKTLGGRHYGIHVHDITKSVTDFINCGYRLLTSIEAVSREHFHPKYKYAFMNTTSLGFITKLIQRDLPK
jgi:hypothetical protein